MEELAKYSKEEIIEALGRFRMLDGDDVDMLLIELEYIRKNKAIEEHKKAIEAEDAAFDAYVGWQKKIIAEYGDVEKVKYNQIPDSELRQGEKLENAWNAARKKEKRLDAKVRKLLNL